MGIVQGLTEFLPVSSSAHLNIMPWLFNWEISDSFDFALHAGTLLAILVYFWRDWIALICGGFNTLFCKKKSCEGRVFWYLVAATVPAGIIGLLLEKGVDKILGGNMEIEMMVISAALIIMGIILYFVDKKAEQKFTYEELDFKKSFLVGISQALAAAFPGVSRSGITMTVARSLKLDRESAAKFSFLLSAPIVGGGVLVSIISGEMILDAQFFAGVLSSFIVGLLVIKFLLGFLKKRGYGIFAVYRVILGVFILIISIIRI